MPSYFQRQFYFIAYLEFSEAHSLSESPKTEKTHNEYSKKSKDFYNISSSDSSNFGDSLTYIMRKILKSQFEAQGPFPKDS